MTAREMPEEFLVAFSLAGEQRELVRAIAEALERKLGYGTVFLDEWFEYYLAGPDGDLKLQEIYSQRCKLAVVCISQRYGDKQWTQTEHRAIRARFMKGEQHAILPIRVGDGEVEGILFNTIVPDVRSRSSAESVQLILDRLHLVEPQLKIVSAGSVRPEWRETSPALSWPMADHSAARKAFS